MFCLLAGVAIDEDENNEMINKDFIRIRKKVLRDISDPFRMDPQYFKQHYRLTRALALDFCNLLYDHLKSQRNTAIPIHLQVLSILRLFAEGAFQKGVSNDFNHTISQASVSRCLNRVIDAILALQDKYIQFPTTTRERQNISNSFRRYIRIPSVIGLIDCYLVAIRRPIQNEESFHNYKVGSSLNVQMITDANYVIRCLCICPGSNTDRFIWNVSDIKSHLQSLRRDVNVLAEEGSYYLLGDSGYTPSPILLTPIINALEGTAEATYTNEHVRTRCKIEQTFGILSNTWMIISKARKLYYQPEKVSKIITCCVILHNFRRINGIIDEEVLDNVGQPNVEIYGGEEDSYLEGIAERNNLILRHYR